MIDFFSKYDDGRSKSFFCISCALLPLNKLKETLLFANQTDNSKDIKEKNKLLKSKLINESENLGIELKLNKHSEYFETTNYLLMKQLLKCPIKQLPMYSERTLECITDNNKQEFVYLLENRFQECEKESQKKRLEKILKCMK